MKKLLVAAVVVVTGIAILGTSFAFAMPIPIRGIRGPDNSAPYTGH